MDLRRPRRSPLPRIARALVLGAAGLVATCAAIALLSRFSADWLDRSTIAAAQPAPSRATTVEIPETYELANVALSLTRFADRRRHTIYRDSPYYRSVIAHFGPFRSHPLIARLDAQLAGENEWHAFYGFRENSVSFALDTAHLGRSTRYPAEIWRGNVFVDDSALVDDFARATRFHEFFRANAKFYRDQVAEYERETPVVKMWEWLEARFPSRYDRYRIVFSPLSYGSHSTQRFETGGVRETIMFIAGPYATEKTADAHLREAEAARLVFTEIDHNYVNPVSDRFRAAIDSVFADTKAWNHDTQGGMYDSPYSTFNEYMTWGVFLLYAKDTYDDATFRAIEAEVVQQMEGPRGFVRFGAFNQELLESYAAKGADFDGIYDRMLKWAAQAREQ